jgi:hypothetical protein
MEYFPKGKDSPEPQENADRIYDNVVYDDRLKETLLQGRRNKQRFDDSRVVPNVERATENLRYDWSQRSEKETVSFAGHFCGSVHG